MKTIVAELASLGSGCLVMLLAVGAGSAEQARHHRPTAARRGRIGGVGQQGQCEHEGEASTVSQHGDQESIGTLCRIASAEIADPPAQHRREAETDRHELLG